MLITSLKCISSEPIGDVYDLWPGALQQTPRLQGGVEERDELRFIPIRRAPRALGAGLHI